MNVVNCLIFLLVMVVNLIEIGQFNKNVICMGYIIGFKFKVVDGFFSICYG